MLLSAIRVSRGLYAGVPILYVPRDITLELRHHCEIESLDSVVGLLMVSSVLWVLDSVAGA